MSFSRKTSALGILIALVIGVISGYVVKPEVDTTELKQRIDDLEEQITTLQNEIINRNTQIDILRSRISELESQVTDLEQQLELKILGIYFSPKGGCEGQILYWIDRANESINVLIYSFTSDSIGDALVGAHNIGIGVQVVFEKSQIREGSEYWKLKAAGIAVRNDTNSGLMHDKVMIVDGLIVLTGSFNWSEKGEDSNNENLIVIESTYVAEIYGGEFTKIWDESQPSGESDVTTEINVVISYVHYDAEGNDWYNLNGEYVVIWNKGTTDVSLTSWRLRDKAYHQYTFPSFTLRAGQKVTVHTGSGTNTGSKLYWGSSSPISNNDGDTAYLYDQNMELIDTYSW